MLWTFLQGHDFWQSIFCCTVVLLEDGKWVCCCIVQKFGATRYAGSDCRRAKLERGRILCSIWSVVVCTLVCHNVFGYPGWDDDWFSWHAAWYVYWRMRLSWVVDATFVSRYFQSGRVILHVVQSQWRQSVLRRKVVCVVLEVQREVTWREKACKGVTLLFCASIWQVLLSAQCGGVVAWARFLALAALECGMAQAQWLAYFWAVRHFASWAWHILASHSRCVVRVQKNLYFCYSDIGGFLLHYGQGAISDRIWTWPVPKTGGGWAQCNVAWYTFTLCAIRASQLFGLSSDGVQLQQWRCAAVRAVWYTQVVVCFRYSSADP